jgi:hypothetical protein
MDMEQDGGNGNDKSHLTFRLHGNNSKDNIVVCKYEAL